MSEIYIVVIDDEKDVRETVSSLIFHHLNINTKNFDSVDNFINSINETTELPDLIISDVHMPTGSGLHLIHDLEKLKIVVPVIYISSMVDMIPKRENVTIIRKPLIVSHFIDEIKKSLKI